MSGKSAIPSRLPATRSTTPSLIYVMGPDGAYRTHFAHTTNADAMAERLAKLL